MVPGLLRRAYSHYFAHSKEKRVELSTRFLVAELRNETESLLLRIRIGLNSKTPMKNTAAILLSGLFILTACASANQTSTTPLPASPSLQPTATELRPLPTSASPGDSITWDQMQVTM